MQVCACACSMHVAVCDFATCHVRYAQAHTNNRQGMVLAESARKPCHGCPSTSLLPRPTHLLKGAHAVGHEGIHVACGCLEVLPHLRTPHLRSQIASETPLQFAGRMAATHRVECKAYWLRAVHTRAGCPSVRPDSTQKSNAMESEKVAGIGCQVSMTL